jgi:hypothetical protein
MRKISVLVLSVLCVFFAGACSETPPELNDLTAAVVGNNDGNIDDDFRGISLKVAGEINQTCDPAVVMVVNETNADIVTDTVGLDTPKRIPLDNGQYHAGVEMDCFPTNDTEPTNHYAATSASFKVADNEVPVQLKLYLLPHSGGLFLTVDIDSDGDSYSDDIDCDDLDPAVHENCGIVTDTDSDGDGITDNVDNCPEIPNPAQNSLCGHNVVYISCTSDSLDLTAAALWSDADAWTASVVRNGEWAIITPIIGDFQFNVQTANGYIYRAPGVAFGTCFLWHEGVKFAISMVLNNNGTGYNGKATLPLP